MHAAPAPVPFAALRLALAALLARAEEIGVFVFGGMLDYYLSRRLERKLAAIIADVRIALLHRAFELIPTLRAFRPRSLPEPVPFDDDAPSVMEEEGDDEQTGPAPEQEPRTIRPSGIVLWPVGRRGHDHSAKRAPYYWLQDNVSTRRLAGRFRALERMLADVDRYARKLARILTQPPRWVRHHPELVADAEPEPVIGPCAVEAPSGAVALDAPAAGADDTS
jgi:hypothetical protein